MAFFVAACFLPAMLISLVASSVMRLLAPRWGLVDRPSARKDHRQPIPLGGGIAIWIGVVLPLAAAHGSVLWLAGQDSLPAWLPAELEPHLGGVLFRAHQMWAVLAAGSLLALMGLIDDFRSLPWWPRLIVQLCVAVALVSGGVRATVFLEFEPLGAAVTVVWMLVLVNAFNFLDNMDGLSAGIALIASILFAAVMLTSTSQPRWLVGGLLLVLAGSLAGFLWHNRPPARVFMGDAGSYLIGLLLATTTVLGTFYEQSELVAGRHVILAPLCILAVPLYDFSTVLWIRLREGRSPFHPDTSHFSHRLVELGLRPSHAVLTIYLATLTTGLGALLLYEVPGWSEAWLVLALIGCVLAVIAILETAARRKQGDPGR